MKAKVIFTGTADWWQIVSKEEIKIDEGNWGGDYEAAFEAAELNADDDESWVACVTEVSDRHSAIKVGDYVCCQGIGDVVIFVRLHPDCERVN